MRTAWIPGFALGAPLLLWSASALAQSGGDFDKKPEDTISGKEQVEKEKGEKMPGEKEKPKPPDDSDKWDATEDPAKKYTYIGMRFRNIVVPKFLIGIFADGGASVNV